MADETLRLQIYAGCMDQIKSRIALVDQFLSEWRSHGSATDLACELSALQLRKIYELIAFASISADLEKYRTVSRKFDKDWNFAEIIKTLSQLNPEFLAKPVRRVVPQELGVNWHFEERPEAALSKGELLYRHGHLHSLLHAGNPFGTKKEARDSLMRIDTWVREVGQLLSQHRYVTGPHQEGYIIELNGQGESVTAFPYKARV